MIVARRNAPGRALVQMDGTHGRDPHRHFGLALRTVAGEVLSARPPASARARVRLARAAHDRDQRLVLLAAAAGELRSLVPGDAPWVRVCREGIALHHPHEAAA